MKHTWINLGKGKKQCTRCKIIKTTVRDGTGYNQQHEEFHYVDNDEIFKNIPPPCKL